MNIKTPIKMKFEAVIKPLTKPQMNSHRPSIPFTIPSHPLSRVKPIKIVNAPIINILTGACKLEIKPEITNQIANIKPNQPLYMVIFS
jgi:hypothetical protein